MHKAWDHRSIIEVWAVESLRTVVDDGSHAFLFINLSRGQEGLHKSRNEKTIILITVCAISYWMF